MNRSRYPFSRTLMLVGVLLTLAAIGWSVAQAADAPNPLDAVQAAWQRAAQAGAYHFRTEIVQTTYPAPTLANVGRSSRVESVYIEGQTDARTRQFLMTLWNEGGSALNGQDAIQLRIEDDKMYGRTSEAEWQEMPDFSGAFAPGSDLMAYLAGVRDVVEVGASISLPDTPYAVLATEYAFTLDGPGLARHVRDQLEAELSRKGELPIGVTLDVSNVYHNATGAGQVWIGADGLPLRLALHIFYPRQLNGEQVEAYLTTDFFSFAEVEARGPGKALASAMGLPRTPEDWRAAGLQTGALLGMLGLMLVLITQSRSRWVSRAVVLTVIVSMVVTPLLTNVQAAGFMDAQAAKQAALQQQQDEQARFAEAQAERAAPNWDPLQDPLQNVTTVNADPALPSIALLQTGGGYDPYSECTEAEKTIDSDADLLTDCQESVIGTNPALQDTDGDGLWDGWEVLRLGTDPLNWDSDGDGISDRLEVDGFLYMGKRWYSNPNAADTDKDGLADNIECPERRTVDGVTPHVDTPCRDTDGDGIPDLFDLDSDNDGVPDAIDLSPLTVVGQATPFSRTNPFQWQASNFALEAGATGEYYPVIVDYQLRPTNPKHLTYVMNVLDWPSGDEQGQMQRRAGNDTTFADAQMDGGDARGQNGDVRLIPMLEIELSGANLPLPYSTDLRTSVAIRGVDTSWPVSSTPPVFTTWLEATLDLAQGGTASAPQVNATLRLDSPATVDWVNLYEGTCSKPGDWIGEISGAGQPNPFNWTIPNARVLDLADGDHFVVVEKSGHEPVCVPIPDVTNAGYTDRMIDPAPLAPYGITVRDKDQSGAVLMYVPVNIVPDASGGGRVAFSARVPYFPNNGALGSETQKVRLVWLIQALSDMCKPSPTSASMEDAEVWCDHTASWDLNVTQVVHTYSDDWYLTGLTVREDHGFDMAIVWEDPAAKTAEERQYDNWLWLLSMGLEETFLSGRDADDNGLRDLGVTLTADGVPAADTTIGERFDAPLAATVTITDRWSIPLTATLQVENVSYATQDEIGLVMMTDTVRILNTQFAAYTDATPSLLFAREERYRTANLDVQETRSINDGRVTFNLSGQKVNTLAAMNWAPYRYRDGAWRAFPLTEYWDLFGARLKSGLALDPEVAADVAEHIRDGQIVFARSYYLAMNQGRVALVGIGDDLLHPYNPLQGDGSLTMMLSLIMTRSGYGMARGALGGVVSVVAMVADTMAGLLQTELILGRYAGSFSRLAGFPHISVKEFLAFVGEGLKTTAAQKVSDLLDTLTGTLNSKLKVGAAVGIAIVAAVAVIATVVVGFVFAKAELMLSACISVITATVQVVLAIKTIYEAVTKSLAPITTAAKVCAVIGFIIGVGIAFAGLVMTLVAGRLKLTSTAAHAAMAEAIAYAVVAAIMLVISLIPVVGQVIAAILGAIDALIVAICGVISAAVGRDVRKSGAGQWFCKGISGLTAELIKWGIYSARTLTDLQDPDRLQFGRFDYALSDPDKGLTVGNDLYITLDVTSTIKLVSVFPASDEVMEGWQDGTTLIPADWKSISYWWQFSDKNVKRSTFRYVIQHEEVDIHDALDLDQMNDEWTATGAEHIFVSTPTPASDPIPLSKAGINRPVEALVTEGTDVAVQECFVVPTPLALATGCFTPYLCLAPVCVIRGEKNSNHIPLGDRFVLDVLPGTLDEFYTALAVDGGYTLAWGQDASLTFGRQADFDGDGLLGPADGGADPDDSKWDTDGDGLSDAWELARGTNPLQLDTDGDGLSDAEEIALGTDPLRKDTDGDGLTDKEEVDGWEIVYAIAADGSQLRTWVWSDPLNPDADEDGLTDFKEKVFGYHPNVPSDPNVLTMSAGVYEPGAPSLLLRFDELPGAQAFTDRSGLLTATCAPDSAGLGACPDAGQDGRYAYAAQFGSGDALALPNGPVNRVERAFTVAAWVRPAQVTGAQNILATAPTVSSGNGFAFGLSGNSVLLTTRGVSSYTSAGGVTANQWTHVAVVFGDGSVRFYVNGALRRTVSAGRPVTPDPDDALIIGATSATDSFIGLLDDVAFFDRVLTSAEVLAVMQGRFNVNDGFVVPAQTVAYTATLTNKLMGRYFQGLLSLNATPPQGFITALLPQTFILQPLEAQPTQGDLSVGALDTQPVSLTQTAQALVTDWREQSNYARLWLPLDDATGQTVFLDHSGALPAANGTCSGNACPLTQKPGYFEYALEFNGVQFVTLPDTVRLGFKDSSFAVSAWVNANTLTGDRNLLSTAGSPTNPALNLMLRNGKPTMGFAGNVLSTNAALQANRWYHLVFRYDKDRGEQTIYVNGELQASRTGIAAFSGTGAVSLGSAWRGGLDDVRVYDRAISASEIHELYDRPVLRLQFEETTRSTATQPTVYFADISGLGNTASCAGDTCPSSVPGAAGQRARQFDGNDYISMAARSSLGLTDGLFTLSAWVWPDGQGEPVTPACAFQTEYYNNATLAGTPAQTGCTNWLDASMDAGEGSQNATWLVNYAPSSSAPMSTRWTGQFNFAQGDYVFNFTTSGGVKVYVDGVKVIEKPDSPPGLASGGSINFSIAQSGVHEIKIEYTDQYAPYGLAFGWMPPHVQGILGKNSGRDDAYPSLLNVGGRLRFGFGTGQGGVWVSRTTTETVLTPNAWNHVVVAFGPRYKTDGSFDQNVATLYVNNQKEAEWGVGSAAPSSAVTSFDIGRASHRGAIYLDYFKVLVKADESPNAEIYLTWNGNKICSATDDPGDDCIWGDLKDDAVRNIQRTRSFVENAELRAFEADDGFEAGHNYGDDPLCDTTHCTKGYTFDSDDLSIPWKTFVWKGDNLNPSHGLNGEDQTKIALYLGDQTHWAYRNPAIPFRGRIDEVLLYKRAFSAEEVQELYLSASMALHLRLDEAPGVSTFENSVDLSRQSNAFCSGSACPTAGVAGRLNQAALFDGADDWLSTTLTLDPASGATLMAWVRPASGGAVTQTVLSTDGGAGGWGIVRDGLTWKVLSVQTLVDTGAAVTPNEWQHVAVAFGRGGLTFYLNGQVITSTQTVMPRGVSLAVGRAPGGGSPWAGTLDDVRVFNTRLSPADVQTMYEAAPRVHLHLDEPTGATQFANIINAHAGTCTICPQVGVDGQVGQAVEFNLTPDHTSDRITIAAHADLNLPRFSVGAWVQPAVIRSSEQVLVSKGNNYRLSLPANGLTATLTFAPVSGSGCGALQSVASQAQLIPNQWNYVMGTYDGSTARIYVNGYEQGSRAVNGGACASTAAVSLGGTSATDAFAGRLDEVALYARALNPFEVRDIFRYQGKLVQERQTDILFIDNTAPASQLRSYNPALLYLANRDVLMYVEAFDAHAGVGQVELLVTKYGQVETWVAAPACMDSAGDAAWCPLFKPTGEGRYSFVTRATDWAGNREPARPAVDLYVDATPPVATLAQSAGAVISALPHPTLQNTWFVQLNGNVTDPVLVNSGNRGGSGVQPESVRVALVDETGAILGGEAQAPRLSGGSWNLDYLITQAQPTGRYTVRLEAIDRVGNRADIALATLYVDATAPGGDVAGVVNLPATAITGTQTLQGVLSEAPAPRDTALLLHLEEAAGATRFYDNSGAHRHADCSGATCPTGDVAGVYGRAASFSGSHHLQIAHSALNERTAGFSIAAWINPTALTGVQRLVATARTRSVNGFGFGLQGNKLLFTTYSVKDYTVGALSTGQWTHVAVVVGDDNSVSFYQNGVLQGVFAATAAAKADLDDVLLIGAGTVASSATLTERYTGLLDEVVVVERALLPEEVRALAQSKSAGLSSLQVAWRPTLPGSPFYNEAPLPGETLHLTLDDAPLGNGAPDQSGSLTWQDVAQAHHGMCTGAGCPASGVSGRVGSAAAFNRSTIALPNWGTFTNATVSAWVRRTGETGARETIISYKETGSCGLVLSLNEDKVNHYPRLWVKVGSAWKYVEQAVSIPLNEWVHLAASYDGANIHLYRDGQLVASTAAPGAMAQCTGASHVGSRSDGVSHFFPGVIDEVRMFDRALDAAAIREQLYLGGNPTLHLPLDEVWATQDTRLPDASGWGHDGVLHIGVNVNNKATPGAVGSFGLNFDGVDDYVALESSEGLRPGADFSLAAWVYPSPADNNAYPILSSDAYIGATSASPYLMVVNRTGLQTSFGDGVQAPPLTVHNVLTENTWNHVAATFDGTTYRLYVNGVERLASTDFAGRQPVGSPQLDVGRGAPATAACVTFAPLTLTPHSMGKYSVALNGTTIYQSGNAATPYVPLNIATSALICAPATLLVSYSGPTPATNWQQSLTLNPQPGQGSQTLQHPTLPYSAEAAWTMAAQSSSLRYWRGKLDDVRIYPRALLPLEVTALVKTSWQAATLAQSGSGVNLTGWSASVPEGLEGVYALILRGADAAGHTGAADLNAQVWSGQVDTLAPRLAITRTTVGDRYRYTTVAEDFNLMPAAFSSPCGAGMVNTTGYYQSPWYRAAVGQSALADKVVRLTADCTVSMYGLSEIGAWTDRPSVSGKFAIVGNQVYAPAGPLWRVSLANPGLPNDTASYNTAGDGRSVVVSGYYAYIADGSRGLSIVNINNPGGPAARLDTPGIASDVAVQGSYAYVADGTGGLRIINVLNPANPQLAGTYATPGNALALALAPLPTAQGGAGKALPAPAAKVEPLAALKPLAETAAVTLTVQPGDILAPAADEAGEQFGAALAVYNDYLVIGAPAETVTKTIYEMTYTESGLVYLWRYDPLAGAWAISTTLTGNGGRFGAALAISDRSGYPVPDILVGAPDEGSCSDWCGAAYRFRTLEPENPDNGQWVVTQTVTGGTMNDFAGTAVEQLGPDDFIVGAPAQPDFWGGSVNAGYIYLSDLSGRFGAALALSGDTLVVGAPEWSSATITATGAAKVYTYTYDPLTPPYYTWTALPLTLTNPTPAESARFGASVDIEDDTIVIGGDAGEAYVFLQNAGGADAWGQIATLTSTGVVSGGFGAAVAIADDRIAVGAPLTEVGGNAEQGAVYVFWRNYDPANPEVPAPDNWGLAAVITRTDGSAGDHFGAALALYGDMLIVGAPDAASSGRAYVYYFDLLAVDDSYTTAEDVVLDVAAPGVLGNDVVGARTDMTVTLVSAPTDGALVLRNDGSFVYTPTLNYHGEVTFTYRVINDRASSNIAAVTLTVESVNDAPIAGDMLASISSETPVQITPYPQDAYDPDGDLLTVTALGIPDNGAATTDGSIITYTSEADFIGTNAFTYTVSDPGGLQATGRITVTVTGANQPPVAVDDEVTTAEDTPLTIYVLSNDSDPNGQPLSIIGVGTPGLGEVTITGDTLRYTPTLDLHGVDSFTYDISDGDLTATGAVTVTISPVNDLPTLDALGDLALDEDAGEQTVALGGITSGAANEAQTLVVTAQSSAVSLIPHPTVAYTSPETTGALSFTLLADQWGAATISVTVSDGVSTTVRAFQVTVASVNDAPTLDAISDLGIDEDAGEQTVALGGITSGAANEAQTLVVTAESSNVALIPQPTVAYTSPATSGSLRFTPVAEAWGAATVTVTVSDGLSTTVRAFQVTVHPVNDAPTAADISVATVENVPVNIAPVPTYANDVDGDILTVAALGVPAHGAATTDGVTITYTPTLYFFGTDAFTYTVRDPGGLQATARITVTVSNVNDPPVAVDDTFTTDEDTPLTLPVLDNDSDPDGQIPFLTAVGTPTLGQVAIVGAALRYTPTLNLHGTDAFTYTISDGLLYATATVTVTILSVNDAPTLDALGNLTINEDAGQQTVALTGITSGAANEAQTLVVTAVSSNPALIPHPTVTYVSPQTSGTLRFTPVADQWGAATVSVTVSDGLSTTVRAFQVTVNAVNDAPTLDALGNLTIDEDAGEQTVALTGITSGAANEAQTLVVTAVSSNPSLIPHPSITYVSPQTSGTLRFTPVADQWGVATINVTVSDGVSTTVRAFQVTLNSVNDAPTLDALGNLTLNEDAGQQTVNLTGITSGAANEAQTLVVTAVSSNPALIPQPSITYLSPQTSGTLRFTPVADEWGSATISVTVSDGLSTTVRAFQVTVNAVNDPPTLNALPNIEIGVDAGAQTVTLSGITTGAANETQTLAVTALSSNPALIPHPTVTYVSPNSSGQLSFAPVAGQTGSATLTVSVSDGISTTTRAFQVTVWTLVGPLGYVAMDANDLLILDLGTPSAPRRLNAVALPGETQAIVVAGTRAYVAAGSAGLLILDIANPVSPHVLGQFDTPGNALGVAVSGDFAYVADGYSGVYMVDISNPAAPTLHATADTPGYASKVGVLGQYVIVADGSGGLRVLDTLAPTDQGTATACDTSGNCTTVAATIVTLAAPTALLAPANLGVSIVNVPPVLTARAPFTLTGEAFAEVASLRALTLTVDGSLIYTTTWAQDAVTRTVWSAAWDPAALADGAHALHAEVTDWAGDVATETLSVIIDTTAPEIGITPVITGANFHAPGMLDLTGNVTDAGGIQAVVVTVLGETPERDLEIAATVAEGVWRAAWSLSGQTLPDGDVFTITARAVDVGGHTTLVTETVIVDLLPPAPVALMVTSGGAAITPGLTLRGLTPTLELTWTASSDGSGLATYRVEWTAALTTTQRVISETHYPARAAAFTPAEGEQVWARVAAEDLYGQQSWQSIGPFYVDAPTTPDHTVLEPGVSTYRGWMDSGCALVGVDRRLSRKAASGAALSAEQTLSASWDAEALRLTWTGANWNTDGDLFIYLDMRPGGATALFNPYAQPAATIHLPGVTPTSTVGAMAADYLVWVRDGETALLLEWGGEAPDEYWDWVLTLDSSQYRFQARGRDLEIAATDLRLPFDLLGISDPANTALELVAVASEEDALRLWVTLPAANPVNSPRVAETRAEADATAGGEFALSQAYHWDTLGAGVCPNGSDGLSPAYPDTDVQVRLTVEPAGIVYSFMRDDLSGLWAALMQGETPDISSQLTWLSAAHPRVGANQPLTYTLIYRNLGTETARGVWVDLRAYYALRFSGGSAQQTLLLGDLAPGAEAQMSFTGVIDLAASDQPWAGVLAQVYDAPVGEPLERIWADHQVDRSGPQFLGIQTPGYILAAGRNTLRGYIYDESPVPAVTLDVQGRPSITCPDSAPTDGAWACVLDATGAADGDLWNVTLRAADSFGQAGTTGAPQTFVVDALPPTVTLNSALSQAAPGSLVKGNSVRLNGQAVDNYGLSRVEACVSGACTPLALQLAESGGARVYDDAPNGPISITAACLVRTFTVTDSFTLGAVNVGFSAAHPHRDDLHVELQSPAGTRVLLLTDDGVSGTNSRHYNVLLDDAAVSAYSDTGDDDPIGGAFSRQARPAEPLRALMGQSAQGQWTLTVCDTHPAADEGAYLRGRLVLTPQAAQITPRAGDWTYTLSGAARVDAVEYAVSFYGIDLAGNRAEALTARYVLDNVAPALTVTAITRTAHYSASVPALAGTVTDGGEVAAVFVSVQNGPITYQEPAELEGETWRYSLRPLTPGRYTLRVSAYDTAGNLTSSGPFAVEVQSQVFQVVYLPLVASEYTPGD